jgi:hypothetical protein
MDEGSCVQERGICRGRDMIRDLDHLVRGPIQRSAIWLLCMSYTLLCDLHGMRCLYSRVDEMCVWLASNLLAYLKPQCLICRIVYTNRNWCHIVATTSGKIST